MPRAAVPTAEVESTYAWIRLLVSLALMTMGGAGMYSVTVVLPAVQQTFDATRAEASLPYTLTMIGFGLGGILMGRLADRRGIVAPIIVGAVGLGLGFFLAGQSTSLWQFALAQGLLIGLAGTAATFAPLVADTSQWFSRHRGIAIAICMSGNYLAGAIWPPILQGYIDAYGWRDTYMGLGLFSMLAMLPLTLAYRRRPATPAAVTPAVGARPAPAADVSRPMGLRPRTAQNLLCVAGVGCCVAMAMPQVHIVALCGDLGYGTARGAEMLALMLGLGIVSRLLSGWISDYIGGLRTLLLGAVLQSVALMMFLASDGIVSLYLVSALFGLFQGGIVPAYALIVREHFDPKEAGTRVGTVLMATLFGMALGGWLSGALYDLSGSYTLAFINGIAWNLLTVSIVLYLLWRLRRQQGPTPWWTSATARPPTPAPGTR